MACCHKDNAEDPKYAANIYAHTFFDKHAAQTPLMMKSKDGLYINIHEAALVNYPAMNLLINKSDFTLTSVLVPDALGNKAYLQAPAKTPWRSIIVSDKATDILASHTILNLNDPSVIKGATDLAEAVTTAVINKRAGGMGLISGRKAFQKSMEDGVSLLQAIQDVYLDNGITVA